jgi:hypothetical protein
MPRCGTAGWVARSGLLPLLVALLFVGCASGGIPGGAPMEIYQKGETSPNIFLSTVIVRPQGCAPFGVACTMAGPAGAVLIVPLTEGMPAWMYEVFAHEMCHVVAAARELRQNPCHKEDDGKIDVRRIGAQGPYNTRTSEAAAARILTR